MLSLGLEVLFKGNNFIRLLVGLWTTLKISIISMIFSIAIGIFLGVAMAGENKIIKFISGLYLEIVRIMPQLVLLFLVFFGASKHLGINLSGEFSAIVVFVFWGAAEMGDLVRSAIKSIPIHQYQSAYALGLTKSQVYRYSILPQTLRSLLPSTINLFSRMIKTTSLVVLIGVVEVVKVGKQIIDASRFSNPKVALWIYTVIFILYFLICFPFSKFASYLDKCMKG